jgi:hypothetical protein
MYGSSARSGRTARMSRVASCPTKRPPAAWSEAFGQAHPHQAIHEPFEPTHPTTFLGEGERPVDEIDRAGRCGCSTSTAHVRPGGRRPQRRGAGGRGGGGGGKRGRMIVRPEACAASWVRLRGHAAYEAAARILGIVTRGRNEPAGFGPETILTRRARCILATPRHPRPGGA